MKKSLNSIFILLFIAGTFLFLFGCGENKTVVIPAEKDLPAGLSLFEIAALTQGVYSLDDLAFAKKLIAEGNVEKIEVSPISFLGQKKRFSTPSKQDAGVFVYDQEKISSMRLFSDNKIDPAKALSNILSYYSLGKLTDFDKHVILTAKGKFCPNLPDQEVTVYKLKCFIYSGNTLHIRYLTVINSQVNGENSYGIFYNNSLTDPKMGDVLAMFLNTLQQMTPSS